MIEMTSYPTGKYLKHSTQLATTVLGGLESVEFRHPSEEKTENSDNPQKFAAERNLNEYRMKVEMNKAG